MDRDGALRAWQQAKANLDAALATERELRFAAFGLAFPQPQEGTNTIELGGGWQCKGQMKYNYVLTKDLARLQAVIGQMAQMGEGEGKFIASRIIKWEPDLVLSEYRKLPEPYKRTIHEVLTIKPGMPSIEIVNSADNKK